MVTIAMFFAMSTYDKQPLLRVVELGSFKQSNYGFNKVGRQSLRYDVYYFQDKVFIKEQFI